MKWTIIIMAALVSAILLAGCTTGGESKPTQSGGASVTPGAGTAATPTPSESFRSSLSQFSSRDYKMWCAGNKFYVFNKADRQLTVEAGLPLIYSSGKDQRVLATIPSKIVVDPGEVGRVEISGDCSRQGSGGMELLSLLYEGSMGGVSKRATVSVVEVPGGLEGNLGITSFDINCSGDTLTLHKYLSGPIQSPRYGYWIESGLEVKDLTTNQSVARVAADVYFPANQEDVAVKLDASIPSTDHYYTLVHPRGGVGGHWTFRCE